MGDIINENEYNSIKYNPNGMVINFSHVPKIEILAKEIINCELTGNYEGVHSIKHGNIVQSKMNSLQSANASFDYVDFKDSDFSKSEFKQTSFDYGAIINSSIYQCKFTLCHFHNVSITGTSFKDTIFIDCDLSNMVIETCQFNNCQFINCKTSNKLFAYTLFNNCQFNKTDIQIQTILGNFGITRNILKDCKIRNLSIDEDYTCLESQELENYILQNNPSSFDKFKIEYFVNRDVISSGSKNLDATFRLETWLEICRIQTTFINLLKLYYEFLLSEYEKNNCTLVPIIKLHTLTGELTERFDFKHDVYNSVMGVHMGLSRIIETYLETIVSITKNASNPFPFLVNGPLDTSFYHQELKFLFEDTHLQIVKLVKHNSPNELFLNWKEYADLIPIVSVFLATRFKIEFTRYTKRGKKEDSTQLKERETKIQQSSGSLDVFQLSVGVDEEKSFLYGLKLKTIFPGSLIVDLRLNISTKLLGKARTILVSTLDKAG